MAVVTVRHPRIRFRTNYGSFDVELYPERTPITVDNFLGYIADHFYDETLIHRVVDNFVIQGGGFEPGMVQKTTRPPIKSESEFGPRNERGTIAMARLAEDVDSATSQFFINTRDNDILNYSAGPPQKPGYCVFGRVVDGMEVVERIEGVATHRVGENRDVPIQEIVIEKARVKQQRQ